MNRPAFRRIPGILGQEFDRLWTAIRALRPSTSASTLTSLTTRGVLRSQTRPQTSPERPRTASVITEHPDYLVCDLNGTAVEAAKPEALRTSIRSDYPLGPTWVQVSYDYSQSGVPGYPRVANYTVNGISGSLNQIIWPPYIDYTNTNEPVGRQILIARLRHTLKLTLLDGTEKTFRWIDLNIDHRVWSSLPVLDDPISGNITGIIIHPIPLALGLFIKVART